MDELKQTNRGFNYGKFTDAYGMKCSIQESSSMHPHLWIGIDDPEPKIMAVDAIKLGMDTNGQNLGWMDYPIPESVLLSTRMHINPEQAQEIVDTLQRWIDTGSLEKKPTLRERIINFFKKFKKSP